LTLRCAGGYTAAVPFRSVLLALVLAGALSPDRLLSAADATKAQEAIDICDSVSDVPVAEGLKRAEKGLALAEEALAENAQSAEAHYAVFCNLGRQIENARINTSTLSSLKRVRREVDRALELKPDYVPALMGKGALLINTPRFFGGDVAGGERLLRRAIALDPEHIQAHLQLAKSLAARGVEDEARAEAQKALELAEARKQAQIAADARAVLAKLK
jgi:tetratricopeptide (TPR) repeat protein